MRTNRMEKEVNLADSATKAVKTYNTGNVVMVAHGKAMRPMVKWPAFKSVYYGI